jgi:hypothetical protein
MTRFLWTTFALATCAAPAVADGQAAPTLCGAQETAYFSCSTARGRSIGLCGSGAGALQYRFGRAGAVELQFPDDPAAGTSQMLFAQYSRYQTERLEIRFENRGSEYVVFDYLEHGRRSAGVRVTMLDAKEHQITCSGRVTSRVAELKGLLRCDADSALNGGNCP